MIHVQNLRKQYNPPNGIEAVKNISFTIQPGEIFSLLGPNGAGKTTTISMLSCLLAPTSGDVLIDGHSIISAAQQVKQVIGLVPQEIALYPTISAYDNLAFWGKMYGLNGKTLKKRIAYVLDVANLTDRARDKVETYSGGMKRRLNIAVGLIHEPKVIYMDEPTVGIDPQSRRGILDTLKTLNQAGLTVLYTTHYMEEAEELSDRIGIIDHGELIALGTQEELTRLVGTHNTILLELDKHDLIDDLVKLSATHPNVHRAYNQKGTLVLEAHEVNAVLPAIISHATQVGGQIKRIEFREANLETVFLHLTGRELRD